MTSQRLVVSEFLISEPKIHVLWLYRLINEDGVYGKCILETSIYGKVTTQVQEKPGDSYF
jgi:hypothetical protein